MATYGEIRCGLYSGGDGITPLREDMRNTVARMGETLALHCTLPSPNASLVFLEFAQSATGTIVGAANWTHASVTDQSRFA